MHRSRCLKCEKWPNRESHLQHIRKATPFLHVNQKNHDEEIREAKEALESKGIALSSVFAYPNGQPGDWNEDVEQVL
jgi:hypothetical protein